MRQLRPPAGPQEARRARSDPGRGKTELKTADVTAFSPEATDERLVVAAQSGSPEAFAALFRRYRPEIARYAGRTIGDDARAEDVVQETFLSALRSIRTLDRPAGFRPWLYRIAHNACVDTMRRRGRGEEVLFDASGMAPGEEIRHFRQAPSSHATLAQKEEFRHLRQALGDLPEQQAQILVMRELEGLSYEDIGTRLRISHSAVESLLFRARRGLRDEYGEISTGERCRKMRMFMAQAVEGVGRRRDRRALVRHTEGCAVCRRDAFVMGLGPMVDDERGGVRRGLSKVAALLPLPGFLNRRSEETGQLSSGGGGLSFASHAQAAINHVTVSAGTTVEHAATAMQKAAAVVAAAAVVGGGGFVASETRTVHPVSAHGAEKRIAEAPRSGVTPVHPGAVLTSPLPSSMTPPASNPPAAVSGTTTSPDTPAAAPPAEPGPANAGEPASTGEPAAAESAEPAPESLTFDIPATSPDPAAEGAVAVEAPAVETPVDVPQTQPEPPAEPPAAEQPPSTGGSGPPDDQPGAGDDSGGSGPIE